MIYSSPGSESYFPVYSRSGVESYPSLYMYFNIDKDDLKVKMYISFIQIFMSKYRIWFRIRPLSGYCRSETFITDPKRLIPIRNQLGQKYSDPHPKHQKKVIISEKFSSGDPSRRSSLHSGTTANFKRGEICHFSLNVQVYEDLHPVLLPLISWAHS